MNAMTSIRGPCIEQAMCALARRHWYVRGRSFALRLARCALVRAICGPEPPGLSACRDPCRLAQTSASRFARAGPRVRVRTCPQIARIGQRLMHRRCVVDRAAIFMHQEVQVLARRQSRRSRAVESKTG